MLTVTGPPRTSYLGGYKSTYPALANGQPVNKTAAIPSGNGSRRTVDTTLGPMWGLPSQYRQKANEELAVAANRRPKETLPTIFARAADATTRTNSETLARGVRQNGIRAILGNLYGHMVSGRAVESDNGGRGRGGLRAYPGSNAYYTEGRQAIAQAPQAGIAIGVTPAGAQRKMQQKGYLDAGQFKILSKPQTF